MKVVYVVVWMYQGLLVVTVFATAKTAKMAFNEAVRDHLSPVLHIKPVIN